MPDTAVHHVTSASDFSSLLASNTYVMADFTASWCGPCKTIAPVFAQLAARWSVPSRLAFAKVDVDEVQPVAAQYAVSAMPTFLFFKDGKQVAVHGNVHIRGADPKALTAAAEKLGGLAKEKQAAAAAGGKDI